MVIGNSEENGAGNLDNQHRLIENLSHGCMLSPKLAEIILSSPKFIRMTFIRIGPDFFVSSGLAAHEYLKDLYLSSRLETPIEALRGTNIDGGFLIFDRDPTGQAVLTFDGSSEVMNSFNGSALVANPESRNVSVNVLQSFFKQLNLNCIIYDQDQNDRLPERFHPS